MLGDIGVVDYESQIRIFAMIVIIMASRIVWNADVNES